MLALSKRLRKANRGSSKGSDGGPAPEITISANENNNEQSLGAIPAVKITDGSIYQEESSVI